jgi:hypothetical protein
MSEKYYPIILAAITESRIHTKIVRGPVEYDDFYSRFSKQAIEIREIKTMEALYKEWILRDGYIPQKSQV